MTARQPRLCDAWDPDPDLPPDHRDRQVCRTCRRVGTPDDAGHTPPAPTRSTRTRPPSPDLLAAARDRDAAILGERED
ncbi:hypothetical protein [Micromonospora fluostatini]|uniref:hypothetical protein n=1 Tax=Micromonospora sp. JCM 30529 TaxID=3421643 RepID=UPI003D17024F